MAENLNCNVTGRKCYDNDPANCTKYGGLYNWATAMELPDSCNTNSCASQVGVKHRGICPSDWHIPSDDDWNVLIKFVSPSCSDNNNCAGAGTKLKAREGWNSSSGVPSGTDELGFSALPSGYGSSDGSFNDVGYGCLWWSSSESYSNSAYDRAMTTLREHVFYDRNDKNYLFSIRCVKD